MNHVCLDWKLLDFQSIRLFEHIQDSFYLISAWSTRCFLTHSLVMPVILTFFNDVINPSGHLQTWQRQIFERFFYFSFSP